MELLSRPHGHRFALFVICWSLATITHSHTSYRGMALSLALWSSLARGVVTPCAETIRLWLLRVGLFVLQRPLPFHTAWTFLIDLTVQIGQHKCLVILGVPLQELPNTGYALQHQSMVVLVVQVLTHSNGEVVQQGLEQAATRVGGVPKQVVSDHGSDVQRGIRLYQNEHAEVIDTYDVTHQLACALKAELEPDPVWHGFVQQCQQTRQQLQQTAGSFLQPPAWRQKARYLNLAGHLHWAVQMLGLLSGAGTEVLAAQLKLATAQAQQWLQEKLGWLHEYALAVHSWSYLQHVVTAMEEMIKTEGVGSPMVGRMRQRVLALPCPDQRGERFRRRVLAAVTAEVAKIPRGQKYLGSTDVLESLFGKYKDIAERSPSREMGASVLALPALTTPLTAELVKEALEEVSVLDVEEWLERAIGLSARQKKQTVLKAAEEQLDRDKRDTEAA